MGYFDEQMRQKQTSDDQSFENALIDLASAAMGEKAYDLKKNKYLQIRSAFEDILRYYHIDSVKIPENIENFEEELDRFTHLSGLMKRSVKLNGEWYRSAVGPFLAFRRTGEVVTLMPHPHGGYTYRDFEHGGTIKISKRNASDFKTDAYCFYKSFPSKIMAKKDLINYMIQMLSSADIQKIGLVLLMTTLGSFGALYLNQTLVYQSLGTANMHLSNLYIIVSLLLCVLAVILLRAISRYQTAKIKTQIGAEVQAAFMMRIVSLPTDFFHDYSSGELANRAQHVSLFCDTAADTFLLAVPTFILTIFFDIYLLIKAPAIGLLILLEIAVLLACTAVSYHCNTKYTIQRITASSKSSGVNYSLINGIQKIKLAGAEKLAFSKWAGIYKKSADITYNPPFAIKIMNLLPTVIPMFFVILYYYVLASQKAFAGIFYSYELIYEAINTAFMVFFHQMIVFSESAAAYEMARPMFETKPEVSNEGFSIDKLKGQIELSHISFRYSKDMPYLYEDLNLQINAGQCVAIVGRSGCGKSSLVRLLLGFEKPERGAVYYDGKDINTLNLQSLRRKIGTVMQNGRLFTGDLYYNIVISAPWLTVKDAWDAAETAGIADDIRNMPMGMQTLVSEDQAGLSGGQRQRVIIARAIAPKPRILIMDEATSALDNVTQKKISESLSSLSCTRIVIAHRLSTVKNCDRILVLDKGKIAEDGTYDKLIEKNGIFAKLVARQRMDQEESETSPIGF